MYTYCTVYSLHFLLIPFYVPEQSQESIQFLQESLQLSYTVLIVQVNPFGHSQIQTKANNG